MNKDKNLNILNYFINNNEVEEVSVKFIKSIKNYIIEQNHTTMNGLIQNLKLNINEFLNKIEGDEKISGRSNLTFKAISEIFMHFFSKEIGNRSYNDFKLLNDSIVNLCDKLEDNFLKAKKRICENSLKFVKEGDIILINGYSKVINNFIKFIYNKGIKISLFITESRPEGVGINCYNELKDLELDIKIIPDSNIGYILEKVDYVISGAEVITENGGIINRIGTYTIGICSKSINKPFYVLAESFKFLRSYPYNQSDIPIKNNLIKRNNDLPYLYQSFDFTPSDYITYIFTDSKVLKPSVVSDEIIQLFDL